MSQPSEKWLPFTPERSYNRRYVNYFYRIYSESIQGNVLDVGAGKNQEERWSRLSNDIERYYSLDISADESLDVKGDATMLPFREGSFDTILLSEVVEHINITSLSDLVDELYRVLTPGGAALVSTPFIYPEHGPPDRARLTPESMEALFTGGGFRTHVYTGGSYGEVLLSIVYRPIGDLLQKMDTQLGWPFIIIHMLMKILSKISDASARATAGRNPRADIWYLMSFTVAKKPC